MRQPRKPNPFLDKVDFNAKTTICRIISNNKALMKWYGVSMNRIIRDIESFGATFGRQNYYIISKGIRLPGPFWQSILPTYWGVPYSVFVSADFSTFNAEQIADLGASPGGWDK